MRNASVFLLAAVLAAARVGGAEPRLAALLAGLRSGRAEERIAAAKAIRALGQDAAPAAAELVPHLGDEYFDVRVSVRDTLAAIGKPAAPHLRAALGGTNWHGRVGALLALEAIGPGAGLTDADLHALLGDASCEIRRIACRAAGAEPPSRRLTQDLAALLEDPCATGEAEAALRRMFGKPSDAARDCAQVLAPLLDKAQGERLALLSALLAGAGVTMGFDRILAQYEADRAAKNVWFCKTLETSKFPAAQVVPVLVREIGAGLAQAGADPWNLARLCIELGRYGAAGAPGVPALTECLRHTSEGLRRYAAQALGNIGPPAAAALPALRELAEKDPEPRVREWAGEAVRKAGGAARAP